MINCSEAAQYFILRAYQDDRADQMTNMKVQKLLYYAQSLYLALFDEPLFPEEIQAWRYGPVCPSAYHLYSEFEANQLPIPSPEFVDKIPPEKRNLLEEVWEYFGEHHPYSLSSMTHLEFPWQKARKGLPPEARSIEPILLEDMKALGHEKLAEIERDHPDYSSIITHLLADEFERPASPEYVKQGEVNDWITSLLN